VKWGRIIRAGMLALAALLVAAMILAPMLTSLTQSGIDGAAVAILCLVGSIIVITAYWLLQGPISLLELPTSEEALVMREEYNKRLLSPRFDELEAHLGGPVPDELRQLYSNHSLLLLSDISFADPGSPEDRDAASFIAEFHPAEKGTLGDYPWSVEQGCFPFAGDGMGNYYLVSWKPGPDGRCPVHFFWHDAGDETEAVTRVADSLVEFLGRPIQHL
jgi:hypothetical protein